MASKTIIAAALDLLRLCLALFKIRNEPVVRIWNKRPFGLVCYLVVPRATSSRLECKEF
jgi:hypothetical protein